MVEEREYIIGVKRHGCRRVFQHPAEPTNESPKRRAVYRAAALDTPHAPRHIFTLYTMYVSSAGEASEGIPSPFLPPSRLWRKRAPKTSSPCPQRGRATCTELIHTISYCTVWTPSQGDSTTGHHSHDICNICGYDARGAKGGDGKGGSKLLLVRFSKPRWLATK